ncbi:AAA family ATPase [Wenyingzhuangia sp. 1_MG-2023]|nr:AAA family ATPase [Wenyingzhuangia sp. 1_MG-2023]
MGAKIGAKTYIEEIKTTIKLPFIDYKYCSISAERDIIPETSNNNIELKSNGQGATNLIQLIINKTENNSTLIEEILLKEFNKIVNPEIHFHRILVQQNGDNNWELFFIDDNKNRISLSKMGSGIKTILIVLLNLIVRPIIEKRDKNKYVFAFEELENNLYPSLQRRLYEYIKNYSEEFKTYFFLTTHSNIVIDTFGTYENSQITHILSENERSITNTTLSYLDTKNIIEDLGIKASDLLQTNGIIWVEGPSDRNFILKWLNLINPSLKEGTHFSIMFYGGRLLSNLTFDYDWFLKEIIPILKINRNAFIMMDRDGKNINTKLNNTKKRIQKREFKKRLVKKIVGLLVEEK